MAGEPALVTVTDGLRRPASLELLKRDGGDAHAGLVLEGDSAAELDHVIIGDVDAVVVVQPRALDLEVGTGLESAAHAVRRYRQRAFPG